MRGGHKPRKLHGGKTIGAHGVSVKKKTSEVKKSPNIKMPGESPIKGGGAKPKTSVPKAPGSDTKKSTNSFHVKTGYKISRFSGTGFGGQSKGRWTARAEKTKGGVKAKVQVAGGGFKRQNYGLKIEDHSSRAVSTTKSVDSLRKQRLQKVYRAKGVGMLAAHKMAKQGATREKTHTTISNQMIFKRTGPQFGTKQMESQRNAMRAERHASLASQPWRPSSPKVSFRPAAKTTGPSVPDKFPGPKKAPSNWKPNIRGPRPALAKPQPKLQSKLPSKGEL